MIIDEEAYKAVNEIEHDVFDNEDVNEFLEHFGVPGMKWGKRKVNSGVDKTIIRTKAKRAKRIAKVEESRADIRSRPVRQRAVLAAVTAGAAYLVATRMLVRGRSPLVTVVAATAAGNLGFNATRRIMDTNGSTPVSALNSNS